jgi:hypothetical protein
MDTKKGALGEGMENGKETINRVLFTIVATANSSISSGRSI